MIAANAIKNLRPGQSVNLNSSDENLINAWNISVAGLEHGVELVLDSNRIDLIVTRVK